MTPWVLRLIIANGVMFLLQGLLGYGVEGLLALHGPSPWIRPWTFVTYMFLHGSFSHIFWNMLSLFFFGPVLESRLGATNFLRLYFISGIVGGLCWLIFTALPMGGIGGVIGASGAVFGVQLGFAYFWPRQQILIFGVFPIEARWLVALMTFYSLWQGTQGGDNVAHFAHLGGFLGGFLFLRWLESHQQAPLREWRKRMQPAAPKREPVTTAVERWSKIKRDNLHEVNRTELDRILDKISASGVASLTPGEREFLDRFSSQLN